MKIQKGLKELGKGFINIGVAFIIFAIIQPFVKEKFSIKIAVVSIIFSFIFFIIGVILASLNGEKDE
jgi:uncharacterized protein YhhL (DUF1145 family)